MPLGISRQNRVVGYALNFGGTDEHVTMGNVLDFANTAAHSIFVYVRCLSVGAVVAGKCVTSNAGGNGRGYHVGPQSGGEVYASLANDVQGAANILDEITSSAYLNDGRIHHIGYTYDGSSSAAGLIVYVDGVARATSTLHATLAATTANTGSFIWGAMSTALQFPFTGQSRGLVVYNAAISAGNVAAIAGDRTHFPDPTAVGATANLVGYWGPRASDSATGTITDLSSGGHNGTATNMEAGDLIPVYHHELRTA